MSKVFAVQGVPASVSANPAGAVKPEHSTAPTRADEHSFESFLSKEKRGLGQETAIRSQPVTSSTAYDILGAAVSAGKRQSLKFNTVFATYQHASNSSRHNLAEMQARMTAATVEFDMSRANFGMAQKVVTESIQSVNSLLKSQ
jgi:hypothetical protein